MPKQKYYVVWRGRKTGVFNSWKECEEQISGFEGARYKSYETVTEAVNALAAGPPRVSRSAAAGSGSAGSGSKGTGSASSGSAGTAGSGYRSKGYGASGSAAVGRPVVPSISVDAACSGNPGDMEYQGVDTATKAKLFHQGPFPQGTVNIGEFLAIVHGLGYLKQRGLSLPIYSDSVTAIKWIRDKKANTKLVKSSKNEILFELIERAEFWLRNNSYDNPILKWQTAHWGEIPADFGRK